MASNIADSEWAKVIQRTHGTRIAANWLRNKGFSFNLSFFILVGRWPQPAEQL